eukprot:9491273-Ditylum_brightwellii.AAC.2
MQLGKHYNNYDTSPVTVANCYITYTKTFKYLGFVLSWDLDDCPDLKNRALQACKSLQAMIPKVFCNPTISLKVKRMLYMAIPMNLLLWGCEAWALKEFTPLNSLAQSQELTTMLLYPSIKKVELGFVRKYSQVFFT